MKLKNVLNTNPARPDPVIDGVVTAAENENLETFPVIGDVILSPNLTFDTIEGVTQYDALLCDGGELDADIYPVLYSKLPFTHDLADAIYLAVLNCIDPDGWPTSDFTDTSLTDYGRLFGNTYVVSPNAFMQDRSESMSKSLTMPETDMVIEGNFFNIVRLWACAEDGITTACDGALTFYEGSVEIFKARISFDGNLAWFHLSAYGGDETTVTSDSTTNKAIFIINESGKLRVDDARGSEAQGIYRADVDITKSTRITIQGHAAQPNAYWISGIMVQTFIENTYLPDMTSPDETCPYRIVSDLATKIGSIRSTPFDKYKIDGVNTFDLLLCDGSAFDAAVYPELGALLFKESDPRWGDVRFYMPVTDSMIGTNSLALAKGVWSDYTQLPTYSEKAGYPAMNLVTDLNIYADNQDISKDNATIDLHYYIENPTQDDKNLFNISGAGSGERVALTNGMLKYYYADSFVSDIDIAPLNSWFHLCHQRVGNDVYIYINGVLKMQASNARVVNSSFNIPLGRGGSNSCTCWVRDYRVTKTTPRYNLSGFTPESTPYPTSSQSYVLPDYTPLDDNNPKRIAGDLT